MTLRIRIEHGQNAGHAWRLAKPGVYVLGRTPAASLQVIDMKVSKDHCRFTVRTNGEQVRTVLEDSDSLHGTELNGQQVSTRKALKPGDEIRVGLSILRVLSDDPSAEDAVPTGQVQKELAAAEEAAGTPKKKHRTFAKDALVGTEVGGYKVIEKIGQGGMGSVYTAEQLSLHREVAFKVLSEKFTSDNTFVDQFVNEARSAAALNHPNVVQVYDVGRENGRYYFSMEFVSGGSIEEKLAEDGAQDWRGSLNWMIDASNALIFAQKRDILHRDVKPDNLMLAEDGSAKLCDLGLAKKAANADMLAAGIIGTPAFISPEAIRRKKDIDVRSDLYSLGCTFYRILTGENPYPAKSVKEILMGHLKAPIPRVSAKKPNIPRDLDDVIFKLMQKEPDERFETPQDLLQSLDKIRVQHGLEAHGLRPASRKPLIIALVAVLVIAGAGLAFLLTRPSEPPPPVDPGAAKREQEMRERAERDDFEKFVLARENEFKDLQGEELRGNLKIGDHWAKPVWPELVGKFRSFADGLEKNEKYGGRDEVQAVVEKARSAATRIEKYVDLRKRADENVKTARTKAVESFTKEISDWRAAFDKAVEVKAWVKAAKLVAPDALDGMIKAYREKQVVDVLPAGMSASDKAQFEDTLLLEEEEHIRPVLEKHLPGDPVGTQLRDQLTASAAKGHAAFETEIQGLLAKNTHEDLAAAREKVEAYQEALPTDVGTEVGELATLLGGFAEQADQLLESIQDAELRLKASNLEHDQVAYGQLLKTLREPGGKGLLFAFRFDEAVKEAERVAKEMQYPGYQVLARQVAEDVTAFKTLFDRLQSTFPAGWSRDKVTWPDARGRDQTEKVKGVNGSGIDMAGTLLPYARLGPVFLLTRVFRDKDGWRFPLEGEDHRGLAVLAEMAVDYDEVIRQYQAYTAWLPAERMEAQQAIRGRLGQRMLLERQAGEAWKTATDSLAQVESLNDAHDPDLIGEEEFWDDKARREAYVERKRELNGLLDTARRAQATLQDPRYATTLWGSAVRDLPESGIRYAGEPEIKLPDEPEKEPEKAPEAPPAKDGDEPEEKPGEGGDGQPEKPDDKPKDEAGD